MLSSIADTPRNLSAAPVPASLPRRAVLLVAVVAILGTTPAAHASGGALRPVGCVSDTGSAGCADVRQLDGPQSLGLSPDGAHVYVAAVGSNTVTAFSRDAGSGLLTQLAGTDACVSNSATPGCVTGRALSVPAWVEHSPDGAHLYVASAGSDAVAAFRRSSGVLEQLGGSAGCVSAGTEATCAAGRALDGATHVVVSPDGENAYVASFAADAISVFRRDTSTGELSQLSGPAGCINRTGADGCVQKPKMDGLAALAMSPDGEHLYAVARYSQAVTVFARAADGSLTQIPGAGACVSAADPCEQANGLRGPNAVIVSRDGKHVYVASFDDDSTTAGALAIFSRNSPTGKLTQLSGEQGCFNHTGFSGCAPAVAISGGVGLAESPGGGNVYLAAFHSDAVAAFSRNASSGALAQLPGTNGCVSLDGTGGQCTTARTLDGSHHVAFSPDGEFAYVPAKGSSTVSVFQTWEGVAPPAEGGSDPASGQPSPPPGSAPPPGGSAPEDVGSPGDPLAGGVLADRIIGSAGVDVISGGPGNDVLSGAGARDFISGDAGDDTIDGQAGSNVIDGGVGDDTIAGGPLSDSLNGGSDEDVIRGGDGNDGITGASGRDQLLGEGGNDRIEGGLGKDVIDAGPGNDNIVAIDGQMDTVRCGPGRDVVRADGGDRIGRDCERVIAREGGSSSRSSEARATADPGVEDIGVGGASMFGSGAGGQQLRGTAGNDRIESPAAGDRLFGLGGLDALAGRSGDDVADGGDGMDIVDGGPGADRLLGGGDRDFMEGGPGDDHLEGGAGSNIVNGGIGDDMLLGGPLSDSLNGGSDEDVIRGGDGNDGITGASGRDELLGEGGNDRIEGGLGKDVIDGGDGGDNIVAADGQRDVIRCGRGRDVVRADGGDRISRDCERVIVRRDNRYVVIR